MNDDGLKGRVVIVTGSGRGLGRALACAAGAEKARVVVNTRRDERAAEAVAAEVARCGGEALAVRADVTDELDVERLFDETTTAFGGVDVVVHTAVRGTAVVNQQAARRLRPGSAIVNVSSSEVIAPAIARELEARDITVNGLAPGLEPPGADHDAADLVALLDRWRGSMDA